MQEAQKTARFFAEAQSMAREFALAAQAALKRRKQRNDGVQVSCATHTGFAISMTSAIVVLLAAVLCNSLRP